MVYNVSNARNMMRWYKNELVPNDISSTIPPASFLILHPREIQTICGAKQREAEKILGKQRMLEGIAREHRSQRDGHVCLRKKHKYKLRMLEGVRREHRGQRDTYA